MTELIFGMLSSLAKLSHLTIESYLFSLQSASPRLHIREHGDQLDVSRHLPRLWPIVWDRWRKNMATDLTADLLSIYSRLRQLDTLLKSIFASVAEHPRPNCQALGAFLRAYCLAYWSPFLFRFYLIVHSFPTFVVDLPMGQIPILWDLLLAELSSYHAPPGRSAQISHISLVFASYVQSVYMDYTNFAIVNDLCERAIAALPPLLEGLSKKLKGSASRFHLRASPLPHYECRLSFLCHSTFSRAQPRRSSSHYGPVLHLYRCLLLTQRHCLRAIKNDPIIDQFRLSRLGFDFDFADIRAKKDASLRFVLVAFCISATTFTKLLIWTRESSWFTELRSCITLAMTRLLFDVFSLA